jgi:pimeloyl-ACP methyl ester carboxylesterase
MVTANPVSGRPQEAAPFWAKYVVETNVGDIEKALGTMAFFSGGETLSLLRFEADAHAPCVLVSQGTAGHAYVFAELAYRIHRSGFNVFIMPKHGGCTITQLLRRHADAVARIAEAYDPRVGVFAEGLGGYVAFYMALGGGAGMRSLLCQNSPALLTEPAFHDAILDATGAGRRRRALLPLVKLLSTVVPWLKLPVSTYLDFREMVDTNEPAHAIEQALIDHYVTDPGFDRSYPLSAIASLVLTPPPAPLSALRVPTMFLVPTRGITPAYERDLFSRLPAPLHKQLLEVDGSVFWMVSHPVEAARVISNWFTETLS